MALTRSAPNSVSQTHARVNASILGQTMGGGCGCKLPPGGLYPWVTKLPRSMDDAVLIDASDADDAGVVLMREDLALIQTVDFFTSPVIDAFDFGRIAATNALSDVYAMGGTPISALHLLAYPLDHIGSGDIDAITAGSVSVLSKAGVALVGGHSIDDPTPKFGLAVTGTAHPAELVTIAGAKAGDALVLTKPLGLGAVLAGFQRGDCSDDAYGEALHHVTTLNRAASAAAVQAGANAMTDVTGFGLLGHLHNICRGSGVSATIDADAVPHLDAARTLLKTERGVNGGSRRNALWSGTFASFAHDVPEWRRRLLNDAQTSGGLLVAVDPANADRVPGVVIGAIRTSDDQPAVLVR